MMRRFTVFRTGDLSATHNADLVNEPDKPQFEGVVFTDGTVVVRWLTACVSTSVFDSFETLMRIHGHNEVDSRHGTEVVWHDDEPAPSPAEREPAWTDHAAVEVARERMTAAYTAPPPREQRRAHMREVHPIGCACTRCLGGGLR